MRNLLIGTHTLRYIAGNKDLIEALAFAILIKQARVNSLITNATQRKLKPLFGIGTDRLRRIVANGLSSGFLRKEGGGLIANRLHRKNGLVLTLKKEYFRDAVKTNKRHRLDLRSVVKLIETAIIYNQVSMQESCEDTHCSANSESKPLKVVKRALRRERSMLNGGTYDSGYRGLSNLRIQQLIGKARCSAINAVKNAVKLNMLSKKWRVDFIQMSGEACAFLTKDIREDAGIIVSMATRSAYTRFSNVYSTKTKLMKLANNR